MEVEKNRGIFPRKQGSWPSVLYRMKTRFSFSSRKTGVSKCILFLHESCTNPLSRDSILKKKKRTIRLSSGEHGDREDWKRRRDTVKENRLTVARANEILIKTLLKRVERFARSCREKEIAGGTPIIRPRNRPTANEYLPTNHQVYLTFQSKRR